jgi:hypothetical protein
MCGIGSSREREIVLTKYGETLKNMVLRSPIQKDGIGYSDIVRPTGLGGLYHDQAAGVMKRKRAQQNCINHAENRAVCSYPQRKGQNRNGREPRVLTQLPQRVTNILKQVLHSSSPLRL